MSANEVKPEAVPEAVPETVAQEAPAEGAEGEAAEEQPQRG